MKILSNITATGTIQATKYGSGVLTGSLISLIGVDANGNFIENDPTNIYTFSNGLTRTVSSVKLGGSLSEITTLAIDPLAGLTIAQNTNRSVWNSAGITIEAKNSGSSFINLLTSGGSIYLNASTNSFVDIEEDSVQISANQSVSITSNNSYPVSFPGGLLNIGDTIPVINTPGVSTELLALVPGGGNTYDVQRVTASSLGIGTSLTLQQVSDAGNTTSTAITIDNSLTLQGSNGLFISNGLSTVRQRISGTSNELFILGGGSGGGIDEIRIGTQAQSGTSGYFSLFENDASLVGVNLNIGTTGGIAKLEVFNAPGNASTSSPYTRFRASGTSTQLLSGIDDGYAWLDSKNGNLSINPSGSNVGIGTTTPAYNLDVSGTVGFPSLTQDNALTDIIVQDGSGQLFTRDASSLPYLLQTNARIQQDTPSDVNGGNSALRIETTGGVGFRMGSDSSYYWMQTFNSSPLILNPIGNKVGIGTTIPAYNLDVNGTVGFPSLTQNNGLTNIVVQDNNGQLFTRDVSSLPRPVPTISQVLASGSTTLGTQGLYFGDTNWGIGRNIVVGIDEVLTSYRLQLKVFNNPFSGLQVVNNSNTTLFEIRGSDGKVYTKSLDVNGDMWVGPSAHLKFIDGAAIRATSNLYLDTETTGFIELRPGIATAMRITNAGRVGIGTTTPAYNLDVAGSVGFPSLTQNNGLTNIVVQDSSGQLFKRDASSLPVPTLDDVLASGNVINNTNPQLSDSRQLLLGTNGDSYLRHDGSNFVLGNSTGQMQLRNHANTATSLWTNNVERIKIESNGRVGIGTTTPAYNVDVAGDNPVLNILDTDNTTRSSSIRLATGGGSWSIENNNNLEIKYANAEASMTSVNSGGIVLERLTGGVRMYAGGAERFSLLSSGNVGIGTTTPAYNLDVAGTVGFSSLTQDNSITDIIVQDNNGQLFTRDASSLSTPTLNEVLANGNSSIRSMILTGTDQGSILSLNNGNSNSGTLQSQIAFGWSGSNQYNHFINSRHDGAGNANAIDFYLSDGTANNDMTSGVIHAMTIETNGLGIGTTNPAAKLHIVGYGNTSATTSLLVKNSDGNDLLKVLDNSSLLTGGAAHVGIAGHDVVAHFRGTTLIPSIRLSQGGVGTNYYGFGLDNSRIRHTTNSNEFMWAVDNENGTTTALMVLQTANGRVGIGTTTPQAPLHIQTSGIDDSFLITNDDSSSDASPVITLKRNSLTAADGNYLGQIKFKGENNASQEVVYAKITAKTSDVSDGFEDGLIETAVKANGSNLIVSRQTHTDLKLINGIGLQVDGNVGVGTLSPSGLTLGLLSERVVHVKDDNGASLNLQTNSKIYSIVNAGTNFMINDHSVYQNRFVINASGNVGIGASDPMAKLDVNGDVRVNGSITLIGAQTISGIANPVADQDAAPKIYVDDQVNSAKKSFLLRRDLVGGWTANTKNVSVSNNSGNDVIYLIYNTTQDATLVLDHSSGNPPDGYEVEVLILNTSGAFPDFTIECSNSSVSFVDLLLANEASSITVSAGIARLLLIYDAVYGEYVVYG